MVGLEGKTPEEIDALGASATMCGLKDAMKRIFPTLSQEFPPAEPVDSWKAHQRPPEKEDFPLYNIDDIILDKVAARSFGHLKCPYYTARFFIIQGVIAGNRAILYKKKRTPKSRATRRTAKGGPSLLSLPSSACTTSRGERRQTPSISEMCYQIRGGEHPSQTMMRRTLLAIVFIGCSMKSG